MKVSKHHYAIELAKRGCTVFFIEPPELSNETGVRISQCADHPGIKLVSYRPVFRGRRFLPAFLFRVLLRLQVWLLLKAIGTRPDVVWCFHGYLFENLHWFGAPVSLFFAADLFGYDSFPPEVVSADLVLGVSDTLYTRLQKSGRPVFQINHGLQQNFAEQAIDLLRNACRSTPVTGKLVAGYVGNLRMQALDRQTMMKVISQHPDVQFMFWGSYKATDLNLGGEQNESANAFISFLETQPNVELKGVVRAEALQQEIKKCHMFWLCWETGVHHLWDGSNSHKLLEYMATGCPVVAHYVSSYKGTDYLYMLPDSANSGYPALFSQTVQLLREEEPAERIEKRLQFAIDNSYAKQLSRIEEMVNIVNKR